MFRQGFADFIRATGVKSWPPTATNFLCDRTNGAGFTNVTTGSGIGASETPMSSATTSTAARTGLQIRDPRDAIAGVLFIVFGLAGGTIAATYPLGSAMRMGAGYFPLLVAVVLVLLGAVVLLRSLSFSVTERDPLGQLLALRPALFVAAGVLAFALLVPALGLLLATLALTLLSGYARRQARLLELAGLGVALAGFGGLVFAWGLGLQLPVLPV